MGHLPDPDLAKRAAWWAPRPLRPAFPPVGLALPVRTGSEPRDSVPGGSAAPALLTVPRASLLAPTWRQPHSESVLPAAGLSPPGNLALPLIRALVLTPSTPLGRPGPLGEGGTWAPPALQESDLTWEGRGPADPTPPTNPSQLRGLHPWDPT